MTPETRNQFKALDGGKTVANEYWEGNLNDRFSSAVAGYDLAMDVVTTLFDHVDAYADEFGKYLGMDIRSVNLDVLHDDRLLAGYSEDELQEMSVESRLVKLMQEMVYGFLELGRDQFVVDAIDTMAAEGQ